MSQHGEEACYAMSWQGEEGPVLERVGVSFKNFMFFMVKSRGAFAGFPITELVELQISVYCKQNCEIR